MKDMRDLRRDPRVNFELDVLLQSPAGDQNHRTQNVSYHGVFIVCEDPLPLRTLLRFKANLDREDDPLQMIGLVAHRLSVEEATQHAVAPGMGIQLFSVGSEGREIWRHFVRQQYAKDPRAQQEIKHKEYPNIRAIYPSKEALNFIADEPIKEGALFVRSAELYQAGTRVWFETTHPDTHAVFRAEAIISEVTETPRQNRGVTLAFADPDATSQALTTFIAVGQ